MSMTNRGPGCYPFLNEEFTSSPLSTVVPGSCGGANGVVVGVQVFCMAYDHVPHQLRAPSHQRHGSASQKAAFFPRESYAQKNSVNTRLILQRGKVVGLRGRRNLNYIKCRA